MSEEMMVESAPWESDEAAEDWESDEAIAEDIGEKAWWRRRGPRVKGAGIAVRRADGRVIRSPKLATAAQTNQALATQDRRLDQLQIRNVRNVKNESAVAGAVTLLIGGGLAALGAAQVSRDSTTEQPFTVAKLSENPAFQTSAVIAAAQLAHSGVKAGVYGGYTPTALGTGADLTAVLLLGLFGFGRAQLQDQQPSFGVRKGDVTQSASLEALKTSIGDFASNQIVITQDTATPYRIVTDSHDNKIPMLAEI